MFNPDEFLWGCNYWASHAGVMMWRDWRPDVVDDDFRRLAGLDLKAVRVFPLWPDFRPLHRQYAQGNRPYRFSWPDDAAIPVDEDGGQSGVPPFTLFTDVGPIPFLGDGRFFARDLHGLEGTLSTAA